MEQWKQDCDETLGEIETIINHVNHNQNTIQEVVGTIAEHLIDGNRASNGDITVRDALIYEYNKERPIHPRNYVPAVEANMFHDILDVDELSGIVEPMREHLVDREFFEHMKWVHDIGMYNRSYMLDIYHMYRVAIGDMDMDQISIGVCVTERSDGKRSKLLQSWKDGEYTKRGYPSHDNFYDSRWETIKQQEQFSRIKKKWNHRVSFDTFNQFFGRIRDDIAEYRDAQQTVVDEMKEAYPKAHFAVAL